MVASVIKGANQFKVIHFLLFILSRLLQVVYHWLSQVYCGRYVNEHMVTHGVVAEHSVVLSFSDLSVWCYVCESYVHHQVLL